MALFFTADLHFFHKKMARKRYFSHLPEEEPVTIEHSSIMNVSMVSQWNTEVSPEDTTYILGDVSFGSPTKTAELLSFLNGKKVLIRGNHDSDKMVHHLGTELLDTRDYLMLNHQEQLIAMSHYPMLTWDRAHHGA